MSHRSASNDCFPAHTSCKHGAQKPFQCTSLDNMTYRSAHSGAFDATATLLEQQQRQEHPAQQYRDNNARRAVTIVDHSWQLVAIPGQKEYAAGRT